MRLVITMALLWVNSLEKCRVNVIKQTNKNCNNKSCSVRRINNIFNELHIHIKMFGIRRKL